MSKVRQAALKAYPKMSRISEPHGVIPADYESHYIGDANEEKRIGFIEGYHQAEKDLALTWEDVKRIDDITIRLDGTEESKGMSNKEFYQEVLNRFNKLKEK